MPTPASIIKGIISKKRVVSQSRFDIDKQPAAPKVAQPVAPAPAPVSAPAPTPALSERDQRLADQNKLLKGADKAVRDRVLQEQKDDAAFYAKEKADKEKIITKPTRPNR